MIEPIEIKPEAVENDSAPININQMIYNDAKNPVSQVVFKNDQANESTSTNNDDLKQLVGEMTSVNTKISSKTQINSQETVSLENVKTNAVNTLNNFGKMLNGFTNLNDTMLKETQDSLYSDFATIASDLKAQIINLSQIVYHTLSDLFDPKKEQFLRIQKDNVESKADNDKSVIKRENLPEKSYAFSENMVEALNKKTIQDFDRHKSIQ